MNINIRLLNDTAKIPYRGSEEAAGYDLYACIGRSNKVIKPNETVKINTGIAMEIPKGYFGAIYARSGLSIKEGLRPANCVGILDSDYRGEIIVALHNDSDMQKIIKDGDRIAQLVVQPYLNCSFTLVENLDETKRGNGGFGSTGIK